MHLGAFGAIVSHLYVHFSLKSYTNHAAFRLIIAARI